MAQLPNNHVFCPSCGHQLDAATIIEGKALRPKEGDIGICFKCGTLFEYEEGYFVHELPDEKLMELKKDYPQTYDLLTISHTDHDIENNDYGNMKALCQKCHLNHDKHQHRMTREKRKSLLAKSIEDYILGK